MTTPPPSTAARLRRAGVVSTLMLTTALAAHASAGGHVPGPGVLGVLAVVLAAGSLGMHGRLRRLPVLALLGTAQYAVHHVVVAASGPAGAGAGAGCGTGHAHAALEGCAALPAALPDAGHDAGWAPLTGWLAGWLDVPMIALHALATVVTALALALGDQALAALAVAVLPWLRVPARVLRVPARRRVGVVAAAVVLPPSLRGLTGRPRRGPPRLAGVARCLPA